MELKRILARSYPKSERTFVNLLLKPWIPNFLRSFKFSSIPSECLEISMHFSLETIYEIPKDFLIAPHPNSSQVQTYLIFPDHPSVVSCCHNQKFQTSCWKMFVRARTKTERKRYSRAFQEEWIFIWKNSLFLILLYIPMLRNIPSLRLITCLSA